MRRNQSFFWTVLAVSLGLPLALADNDDFYNQTNLVFDVPKLANRTDPNLVNGWGIDSSPTGPWWVNSNGKGFSLIFDGTGAQQLAPVTIPPPIGQPGPSKPTGIVYNTFRTNNDFQVTTNQPAFFLFVTEDGTISGWYPTLTSAITKVNNFPFGAIYKGVALGHIGGITPRNVLYAANFHSGAIEVYDTTFSPISLGVSAFHDPNVPSGYAPFNVQNIGGSIFVAWAQPDMDHEDEVAGAGLGYVSQFNTDGTFVKSLQHGSWMNAPWGIALAPSDFGEMSGRLLVGQFGSGQIASFDPVSGQFKGFMLSHGNHPVVIDGLWGIKFGNGGMAGHTNELFFAAGPDDENHGLFGTLTAEHGDKEEKKEDKHDH